MILFKKILINIKGNYGKPCNKYFYREEKVVTTYVGKIKKSLFL